MDRPASARTAQLLDPLPIDQLAPPLRALAPAANPNAKFLLNWPAARNGIRLRESVDSDAGNSFMNFRQFYRKSINLTTMIITGLRGVGKTVLLGRFRGTA